MFYTRKGDGGTTKTLHCDQKRISKSSAVAEALGAVDELNSLLGLVKHQAQEVEEILQTVQQDLFVVQAELAGSSNHTIAPTRVTWLEKHIDSIEKSLPPIKSFFLPGASKEGAWLDYARTVARRAERRVTAVEENIRVGEHSRAYLNRLSSLLYALARIVNHHAGAKEEPPRYR